MPSQDNSTKQGSSHGSIGDSMRSRRRAEVAAAQQTGLVPVGPPVEPQLLRSAGEPKVSDEQRSDNLEELCGLMGCTTELEPQGVPARTRAGNAAVGGSAQTAAAPGSGS